MNCWYYSFVFNFGRVQIIFPNLLNFVAKTQTSPSMMTNFARHAERLKVFRKFMNIDFIKMKSLSRLVEKTKQCKDNKQQQKQQKQLLYINRLMKHRFWQFSSKILFNVLIKIATFLE